MAKINPMHYSVNKLLYDKETVIFLGGAVSMEGKQDSKEFSDSDCFLWLTPIILFSPPLSCEVLESPRHGNSGKGEMLKV